MKKIIVLFAILQSLILQAQEIPSYNHSQKFVSDFANILSDVEEKGLHTKLSNYEKQTGTEIAIVTQNDLQDYAIEEYANKLFNEWGIGKKGANNGLLILVSPANRKWRIETGYGLEGELPDMICARLADKNFPPNFKKQEYFIGIDGIINDFIGVLGTKTPEQKAEYELVLKKQREKEAQDFKQSLNVFFAWFVIILIFSFFVVSIVFVIKK